MILPGAVAYRLSRQYKHEELLASEDQNEQQGGRPPENYQSGSYCAGEEHLELTVIGETAVLTASAADELELQAALAYAIVKRRRRRLLEDLTKRDRESFVERESLPFLGVSADEIGEP